MRLATRLATVLESRHGDAPRMPRIGGRRAMHIVASMLALLHATAAQAQVDPKAQSIVRLGLFRMAAATDSFVVSSAVPLVRGAVRRGDVSRLRLLVEGDEVTAYFSPLAASHSDGSLRSVLVQFRYAARAGDRITAQLEMTAGEPARLSRPFPVTLLADAVVLPVDPSYLIATELVGPTIPVAEVRRMGGAWQRYEAQFEAFADRHWDGAGSKWSDANYYDRSQIYYAWWVRTGNPEYWRRATMIAVDYRTHYLEPNKYDTSHHWAQMEGVALHYLLTGDEASRQAVGAVAEVLSSYFRRGALGDRHHRSMEARIMARTVLSAELAWELRAPGRGKYREKDWEAVLPRMLDAVLAAQDSSGAFLFDAVCNTSLNYMNALLNDALIRYYVRFRQDPRIPASIKASGDWLMRTQWRADGSFNYQSGFCKKNGSGPKAGRDLTGLFLTTYGWLYAVTGEGQYRAFGDRLFAASVAQAYLQGEKQFNQQYTSSFRYFAYRKSPAP